MISKTNILILFFLQLFCCSAKSQSSTKIISSGDSLRNKEYKPEIFTSGFIDVMNNGQVNASARFIRLFIGEPGKVCNSIKFLWWCKQ
jgi:hypothetical protein